MFGHGIRIGRLAGIPISVQPLWLLIVALITWSLGEAYYPEEVSGIAPAAAYALGLASALLLFASILLHELGHAIVARRYGVEIEGIQLWLLGGVAQMKDTAHESGEELRFALAGPAVTLAIVLVFGLAVAALPASAPDAVTALLAYQALVNLLILIFNLLPAFPLDGGRVLRAVLWGRSGDMDRATMTAALVGRGFAYVLIALGFIGAFSGAPGALWLGLIGIFMLLAGQAEETAVRLKSTFRGIGLRKVMAVPAVTLDADQTVSDALRDWFAPLGFHAFPVIEGGQPVGLLSIDQIERVPAAKRAVTRVGDVADRDPSVFVGEDVSIDELMESGGFQRHRRVAVLCDDGEVGLISATGIERAVRARRMLGEDGAAPSESRRV
jgi:Zn-dependent protease/CBS domain-containing protein